jgi:hypothetical protein
VGVWKTRSRVSTSDKVRWSIAIVLAVWAIKQLVRNKVKSLLEGEVARATVLKTTERFELKTLPGNGPEEAGWVELRRLSYGEKVRKDSDAMTMRFKSDDGPGKDVTPEVSMINEQVTLREFALCIVDHNLEDDKGTKLDFRRPDHVRSLDPRVGDEISQLIGAMNDFEREAKTSKVDASGKS